MNGIRYEYKIFNPETELFSNGGSNQDQDILWSKTGKTWRGIGPLKNHFHCCGHKILNDYKKDRCEVIKIEVIVQPRVFYSYVENILNEMEM